MLSNQNIAATPIAFVQLRSLIESATIDDAVEAGYDDCDAHTLARLRTQKTLADAIRTGQVDDFCWLYTGLYSKIFDKWSIEHVVLRNAKHEFLAITTSDRGVVIFDPTFRQFYHCAAHAYFLGTPDGLLNYITLHGGMDTGLKKSDWWPDEPAARAREIFLHADIVPPPCAHEKGEHDQSQWRHRLRALAPLSHPQSVARAADEQLTATRG